MSINDQRFLSLLNFGRREFKLRQVITDHEGGYRTQYFIGQWPYIASILTSAGFSFELDDRFKNCVSAGDFHSVLNPTTTAQAA